MATPAKTKMVDKPVKAKPATTAPTKVKPVTTQPAVVKPKAAPAASAGAKTAAPKATKGSVAATGAVTARRALAPDQRRYYVEVAAYYIAEQRGFHGDSQLDDWVAAEAEIDRLLREGVLNP